MKSLDYEFFKTRVEPVFLRKRPAHVRCYVCHVVGGYANKTAFRLQKLSNGNTFWTEDQSRLNFQSVSLLVVPGDPTSSRLLMHPIERSAGGDIFHGGGRQFASQTDPDWLTLAEWVRGRKAGDSSDKKTVRIYIANFAGDTVDVIDPATNKVVQVIERIEMPHDVNFSPDGSRVYVSCESENVLDVVDQKTGEIIKKVPLSGVPNTIAVTKDGGRVFVGIRSEPGALDVIDTSSLERVKTIPKTGPLHDIYLTPDGKYVVAGSEEGKQLTVVDVQTEQPVWGVKFERTVRTMAMDANPDGSTRRIFVNLGEFHGFAVVDFAAHKEMARVKLPDEPGAVQAPATGNVCHGIGVAPNGKTLWVNSKLSNTVLEYSLPDLKLLGRVSVGLAPEWLTFSPDSKNVYDSNKGENTVSVIDTTTLKEVARIPVGQDPERNNTLVIP
jgi:YVTN family beta-propeller protein